LPANVLAKKIRAKEMSSEELVEAYINRINEIQPLVNCVVKDCFDEAIQQAKSIDKMLNSNITIPEKYSELNAPLLGVPFSCKECFWVSDMPNATGSLFRKDFRAPQDADVVKYMREAGAILTCLTNTSQLCMWFESSNYLYGTTKNPYNLSRIVGGSSGGEGCIISSAGSVIGVGSDIGGSIRMPAFFNGVYGHKPSRGIISNNKQHPPPHGQQELMLSTGPICRYASDLSLLFKVLSGPLFSQVTHHFEKKVDLKKLKYYVIKDLQGDLTATPPSFDSKNALEKTVTFLEKSFNTKVNEIKLKKFKSSFLIWSTMISNGTASTNFGKHMSNTNEPINPYIEFLKSIFGMQKHHTLPAIGLALAERAPVKNVKKYTDMGQSLTNELKEILGEDGILIFPSFPICAPYHNEPICSYTLDFIYYGIINVFGFPATQCPLGLSPEGLPTGVQLIANHNLDHLTLQLAEYFEQNKLAGWVPPF
jgi:fatty acid amide hydrolase 2